MKSLFGVMPFACLAATLALYAVHSNVQPQATISKAPNNRLRKPSTNAATTSARKIPCKTPANASLCYWTHGRLTVYNGNPTFWIWKIGTRRMLGVFDGPSPVPPGTLGGEDPEFPIALIKAWEHNRRRLKRETGMDSAIPPPVFADFEVCPLWPEKKGWMQPVCVESAKNIFVEPDY